MTSLSEPKRDLLDAASTIDLGCLSVVPESIDFENLRRRGIDLVRMKWTEQKAKGGLLAGLKGLMGGRAKSGERVITIADQRIVMEMPCGGNVAFPVSEVTGVEFVGEDRGKASCVKLSTASGSSYSLGETLTSEAKQWLRDRLILELSGLVWRPVFNVGKRTTRQTINPDHQYYTRWESKSSKLIGQFLSQAPEQIGRIGALLSGGDRDNALKAAHWLKSSCAAVGATHISELCQRLEIELDAKDEVRARHLVPHVLREFEEVVEALGKTQSEDAFNAHAPDGEVAQSKPENGPFDGLRILIAEDSLVNQEVVKDCLAETGSIVTAVADGQSAVDQMASGEFDVILMDCQMPVMDGFEATRRIREFERVNMLEKMPIIALTANALRDDMKRCLEAGMTDYVSKPFEPQQLLKALSRCVEVAAPMEFGNKVELSEKAGGETQVDAEGPVDVQADEPAAFAEAPEAVGA